jgi:hypothetical protein
VDTKTSPVKEINREDKIPKPLAPKINK